MKIFKTPKAIIEEIRKMRTAENNRREDRATVSAFFNGQPPLTDEEAADLGFTVNVNHLFGYTDLDRAKEQLYSLYTKPTTLFDVQLHVAPPGKRSDWSMKARTAATRVLKKIDWFDSQYEGAAGDAALHGEAVFYHPNKTFPLPRQAPLARVLVPEEAGTDPNDLTHFAIEADLAPRHLTQYGKSEAKGWKQSAITACLRYIYDAPEDGRPIDWENIENAEYRRQENSSNEQRRKPGIDVIFFFQQRCDKPGTPYDLTIIYDPAKTAVKGQDTIDDDCVLYECESRYENVKQFIHPFFMDCIIGGESKWHRVLGLGHLNYQLNHAIELMINRIQQGGIEASMNLWQAKDANTREAIEEIMLRHNGVIPEGMNLVPNRYAANFGGLLEVVQFFRQQGGKNAQGTTPNNGDKNDQLEVQAMFEQNQAASSLGNRSAKWYRRKDFMWQETWRRLTNPYITSDEPGYSEVLDFQAEMERERIPLWWLQPQNAEITAVRIVGDGLRQKELSIVQYLTTNRAQYAPEIQPRITRLCTALALDNHVLAEELTPMKEEEPGDPLDPKVENTIMRDEREPLMPHAADIDEQHVLAHFKAMDVMLRDAAEFQQSSFTPQQAKAFVVIGGHTAAHIKRIESRGQAQQSKEEIDKSRQFNEQLNQFAKFGDKMKNNMEQTQAGQKPEPMSDTEHAKMQLSLEQLALQRQKLEFSMKKFERTQGTREQNSSFDQMLKLQGDHRESQRFAHEAAIRDTETALKIATSPKNGNPGE
jgi:hypothetical protein